MPIFTIETDPIDKALERPIADNNPSDWVNPTARNEYQYRHVRRPHRGLQVTNDTYATIQVVTGKGNTPIIDAGSPNDSTFPGQEGLGSSTHYSNFIVQSMASNHAEKMQVIETFGEHFVFFYGQRPITLNVSGVLLKSEDFGWRNEFMTNYERYLRGTKLVENRARCLLSWEDVLVDGFITSINLSEGADAPYLVNFQFSMILTGMHFTSNVGDPKFPSPLQVTDEAALTAASTIIATNIATLDTGKESNRSLSEAFMESSFVRTLSSARASTRNLHRKMQQYITGRFEHVPPGFHGQEWLMGGDRERAPKVDFTTTLAYGRFSDAKDEYPSGNPVRSAVSLGFVPGRGKITEAEAEADARKAFKAVGIDPDENRQNQEILSLVTRGGIAILGRSTLKARSKLGERTRFKPPFSDEKPGREYGLIDRG